FRPGYRNHLRRRRAQHERASRSRTAAKRPSRTAAERATVEKCPGGACRERPLAGTRPAGTTRQLAEMTYCVGMVLDQGLVLMSDTRTNSGVDNISVFRKMFHWSKPGERIIAIMTAGNLATTQAVISHLEERTKAPGDRHNSLLELPTMFQVAAEAGKLLRETVRETQDENGMHGKGRFTASLIVAGQIKGM